MRSAKRQPSHIEARGEAPKLASAVEISRQFLRSVRIDTDFGREDALSGYVCQGTARTLLESMARQLTETKQRAFTWTGPYGGGKSSLALMLCSLVGPSGKLRAKANEILDLPNDSGVKKAFEAYGHGWLVVPVVGKRASAAAEIANALAMAKGEPYTAAKRKHVDVVAELVAEANQHRQGVLLVIDELGKFLEASAQEGGEDIYFFQQLAEAASRASGKLVVVGILHQAFEAYASRLGREARDDWAKVQGRFVDIPLVSATDEVIELIGRAIKWRLPLTSGHPQARSMSSPWSRRRSGLGDPAHPQVSPPAWRAADRCTPSLRRCWGRSPNGASARTSVAPSAFWPRASRWGSRSFSRPSRPTGGQCTAPRGSGTICGRIWSPPSSRRRTPTGGRSPSKRSNAPG